MDTSNQQQLIWYGKNKCCLDNTQQYSNAMMLIIVKLCCSTAQKYLLIKNR